MNGETFYEKLVELSERVELLEAFDLVVNWLNDTEALDLWLQEGPGDGAELVEYLYLANDNELFYNTQKVFFELVSQHGEFGWFRYNWSTTASHSKSGKLLP